MTATLRIAVLKERATGETRVAATPETVKKLAALGLSVAVESGAGLASAIAIFAAVAYGIFFLAAFALPETRGKVLHADS